MNIPVASSQPVPSPKAQNKVPQSQTPAPVAAHQDTVQISSAALQAMQAMKEATETSSQTAQEALHGDRAAQRLLAKEAAEKTL